MEIASPYSLSRRVPSATRPPLRDPAADPGTHASVIVGGRRHPAVSLALYSRSMFLFREKTKLIEPDRALPGRDTPIAVPARHDVLGTPLTPPFPAGMERLVVGMGCFWGAE